ncbi:alpha/beta family hydrolase [Sphaerisporangium sp. B11E5]|uniref:dienelactone hydrolase family protein n=1 Tax=Sphaerisporangium sp. B11E5 TaxID=3153563 RepID=UPI00325EB1FC
MIVRQSTSFLAAGVPLEADVVVPDSAVGVVVFAHGSGSGRRSPRNRHVAAGLQEAGLATVLIDLLTLEEERAESMVALRFDIGLLASRLIAVTARLSACESLAGLGAGLFGGSTGAAAALVAAAERPDIVRAVVSRGGRPDLAGDHLTRVHQPTLLIVGERDPVVIDLNREALGQIPGPSRLVLVPAATHLFEEPGALDQVTALAGAWFTRHLPAVS